MKYFEISEIFLSFFYAVLYGALGGLASRAVRIIAEDINRLLFIFSDAYVCASRLSLYSIKGRAASSGRRSAPRALYVAVDVLFFFLLGIGFFILSYYSIDGQIRLYMLLAVLFSFLICEKFIGIWFERVFRAVYDKAYFILLFFLSLFMLPIKLSISIINKRVIAPVARFLRKAYLKKVHKNIVNRKLKEVHNKALICAISPKTAAKNASKTYKH